MPSRHTCNLLGALAILLTIDAAQAEPRIHATQSSTFFTTTMPPASTYVWKPATAITIASGARSLVSISLATGAVTIDPSLTLDEASLKFWELAARSRPITSAEVADSRTRRNVHRAARRQRALQAHRRAAA